MAKKKTETKKPTKPIKVIKAKTIAKSAKTGRIVSKEFAAENPDTTFETQVETKPEVKAPEGYLPMRGEKFLLDGQIASIASFIPWEVNVHAVRNGVITDTPIDVPSFEGHTVEPLSKEEEFRQLGN